MSRILTIVLCVLITSLCGCVESVAVKIDAEVLTVNSEILEGNLNSHFLSSSSGKLRSDVIKVGVQFELDDRIFLEDLSLSHAQLAYYKDKSTLPLKIEIYYKPFDSTSFIEIRLSGYFIKTRRIADSLAEALVIHYGEEEVR